LIPTAGAWRSTGWLAAALAVSVVGLALIVRQVATRPPAPAPSSPAKAAAEPPAAADLSVTGRLRARQVEAVGAAIDGTIESIEVIEGQEVVEGQLLARIQNSRLELEEERARLEVERLQSRVNAIESQLLSVRLEIFRAEAESARAAAARALAEKQYQRQQMLLREGAVARLVFEKAEQDWEKARAEAEAASELARQTQTKSDVLNQNLDEARRALAEKLEELEDTRQERLATEIHAPVDGLLVSVKATAGQEVSREARDLFEIAPNPRELEFVANLRPDEAKGIQPGQAAVIQVVESGNQPIAGRVKSVTEGLLVIEFEAPDPAVRPGVTARAQLPRTTR